MRTEEFWTLDDEDEALVSDLELGLGASAARVLAYLLRRADESRLTDSRARLLDIRLGTGLGRQTVIDSLSALFQRELVTESTLESDQGRPPKTWETEYTTETAMYDAYAMHAAGLVNSLETDATLPEEADPGEPVRLGLNWLPNGLQIPFYAAAVGSKYEMAGVDVEFVHYPGSERALRAVTSGEVDIAVVGAATLTDARREGSTAAPLAVLYQRAMSVLYTTRSAFGGQLTESEQLRGRRIGMSPNTETRLLAELFLSQAGVRDAVDVVETTGEESGALLAGDAEVAVGSFSDPWSLRDEHTVDVLTISDRFPMYGPSLVVDPSASAVGTTRLERFLVGTMLGWRAGRRNPTPAARHIADESDEGREEIEATFRGALESFADSKDRRANGWGAHNDDEWERIRTALVRTKLNGDV
jgi:ABC-type nitrate/sulfonate/bicarbonate transport system substrate-binding protein